MAGLKKKYIKQAKGDFKKAWRLQKAAKNKSKKSPSSSPTKGKSTGSKPGGSSRMGMPKVLNISASSAYGLYKVTEPAHDEIINLITQALSGQLTSENVQANIKSALESYKQAGMTETIFKPIGIKILASIVQDFTGRKQVGALGPLRINL